MWDIWPRKQNVRIYENFITNFVIHSGTTTKALEASVLSSLRILLFNLCHAINQPYQSCSTVLELWDA